MDRTSSFPKQDFEGMVSEIWLGLNICLYHAAYVRVYANTIAMHLAGSKRRHTIIQAMSQTEREQLQEDLIVFRAHFAGVLWQLHHLADELLRVAYRRCKQEGVVTKDRHDALVKVLDDDPVIKEIRDYRNLSHQLAGVIVTLHDTSTDAFIAHVFPPLDGPPLNEINKRFLSINGRCKSGNLTRSCKHTPTILEGIARGFLESLMQNTETLCFPAVVDLW
jgi:hypothetical protein